MIALRADVELIDNIVMAMPKITREGHIYVMSMLNMSGNLLGVHLVRFLDIFLWNVQRIQVLPTSSSSSNKKKGVVPTVEVSNSNPFEVLNLVDNDVELGTNRETTNLVYNGATSSGSSFMNVDNSSTHTTPIIDKIRKFEELLTSGQAILVDERNSYRNDDYDEDPYDDDMYEGHDLPQEIKAICDNLDIRVQGRKKK
ncbi:hypothetical protein Tco_0863915 [Tanacetum coccineum]